MVVELAAHAPFPRGAKPPAELRVADQPLQCRGKRLRAFRRHHQAVFAIFKKFRNAGDCGRYTGKPLARRLHEHIRQAVAVTIGRHPARQCEDVGPTVAAQNILLIECPVPADAILDAKLCGKRLEPAGELPPHRYARSAS